jgi:hypothetical protein
MQARGTFAVSLTPAEGTPPGLGRLTIDKTFEGDLAATSMGEMLAAHTETKGSAGYVAMEKVTGTLAGKEGSFVLQHSGTMNRGEASLVLTVVPDSGTDALRGLSGSMQIIRDGGAHSYEFEYELATTE